MLVVLTACGAKPETVMEVLEVPSFALPETAEAEPISSHSELNAILNYRGGSLEGTKIYVTLFPCNECAKAIIQSGIRELVYADDKYGGTPASIASRRMLKAAGVKMTPYQKNGKQVVLNV